MTLLQVAKWLQSSPLGASIEKSTYLFPAIEVVHLLGLTLLLGSVLILNMRLLSLGPYRQSVPEFTRTVSPLFWTGFWMTIGSGVFLFLGEAVKCYFNEAFVVKMVLLLGAVLFQVTIDRRVRLSGKSVPLLKRSVAIASLSLWFGVGIAGRAIGFI